MLSAYLGEDAGRRVLEGQIHLGDVEQIPAIIWFSDLRDSTAMAERIPVETFLEAVNAYFGCTAGAVLEDGGEVLRFIGDAVLAKFDAVVDAMSAAVAVQRELEARNEDLPEERKVQFRIGVNSGDVIEDRGDIYGDGVNVAGHLESLADPAGICISDAVRTAVGKKLDLEYGDMGEQDMKNIAEPVRAYRGSQCFGTTFPEVADPRTRMS